MVVAAVELSCRLVAGEAFLRRLHEGCEVRVPFRPAGVCMFVARTRRPDGRRGCAVPRGSGAEPSSGRAIIHRPGLVPLGWGGPGLVRDDTAGGSPPVPHDCVGRRRLQTGEPRLAAVAECVPCRQAPRGPVRDAVGGGSGGWGRVLGRRGGAVAGVSACRVPWTRGGCVGLDLSTLTLSRGLAPSSPAPAGLGARSGRSGRGAWPGGRLC